MTFRQLKIRFRTVWTGGYWWRKCVMRHMMLQNRKTVSGEDKDKYVIRDHRAQRSQVCPQFKISTMQNDLLKRSCKRT